MKIRIVASLPRKAGWWEVEGGVCGDPPADLVNDYMDQHVDTTATELLEILANMNIGLGGKVADCWEAEWGRKPSMDELDELVGFCLHAGGDDETDD
jgi:hypothetical protein